MKKFLMIAVLSLVSIQASADCTRYCNPEKSKPCGKSCISKDFTCHKPVTTACSGKKPTKTSFYTPSETEATLNKLLGI